MKKVIICVLGKDRPGILATTTGALYDHNCNLENVSQTILQSEFAGIFIATTPDELTMGELNNSLERALNPMSLYVFAKPIRDDIPIYQNSNS